MNDLSSSPVRTPGPGHNQPGQPIIPSRETVREWLDLQYGPLLERRDEIVAFATRIAASTPQITSDAESAYVSDLASQTTALRKRAKGTYDTLKEEFASPSAALTAWRNSITDAVESAVRVLQERQTAYLIRRDAEVRAEQRRQAEAEAAAAAAQVAAALAAQATGDAPSAEALFDVAEQSTQRSEKLQTQAARRGSAGVQKTDYGTTFVRTTWKHRVTNFALLPDRFKKLDDAAVNEAKAQRDPVTNEPTARIPGLEWYAEQSSSTRSV